ncbi:NAD-P-binding protein [Pilatotrama ljubarskyi]|nr:NAD-P-binding protein [Pilatotrama ljubarskyi]
MFANKLTIFLTGATGYIGGSVLRRLLEHPNHDSFEIVALVRNAEKAKLLETKFGVKTVLGSLQDLDKLSTLAENAHIVIQTADCDNTDAIKAILSGLKKRHEKTGDLPILIHTSGTGEFIDDARGEYVSETFYSDLDIPKIEALPDNAPHRPVDLLVVAADTEGYVRSHIIMPSLIYGIASGPLFDAGIANPHSIAIPLLVRIALQRGSVGVMGKGVTRWGHVHINDTADLYIRLIDALLRTPEKVSHGRLGYYIAENGDCSMRELLEGIAEALVALGRIRTSGLVPYAREELAKYFGSEYLANFLFTNSRCKAERARLELGWAPKYTQKDVFSTLKPEVEIIAQKEDAKTQSS